MRTRQGRARRRRAPINRTLVMGIGNSILTDDSVGLKVAQEIKNRVDGVDLHLCEGLNLGLLEVLDGYRKLVVIDALETPGVQPSEVVKLAYDDKQYNAKPGFGHGLNLPVIISLGAMHGLAMPEHITVFGIGIKNILEFSEQLSREVQERFETIVATIQDRVYAQT